MSSQNKRSIVVIGGGTAGVAAASLLEKSVASLPGYEVILITGKDYYYHLIAGLRANVSDAELAENLAVPYDKLFKNQTLHKIITKRVKEVKKDSVVLEDGTEIPFAYCVVATGKKWMAPNDIPDSRVDAINDMKAYRDRIAAAKNIVVIGGGAVGCEMAGEIASSFKSSKKMTLIHAQSKLINDTYNDKFRDGLQKQLLAAGVNLHLGDRIEGEYDFASGPVDLKTKEGHSITGVDLVIPATGGSVNTSLLQTLVPQALSSNGVKVKPTFQLEAHDNIFAIGDVADLPEQKQAAKAPGHAAIANTNIVNLINGKPLIDYKAPKEMIVVNVGKTGGIGFVEMPLFGKTTLGPWMVKNIKGKKLFLPQARTALGY